MSPLTIILLIVLAILIVLAGLLYWQSQVRPYTFDELFVLPEIEEMPMESPGGKPRIIPMEGAANFRDLGGYMTEDGMQVNWGCVFRSDRLGNLTERDFKRLKALDIQTAVDFRQSKEAAELPNRLPDQIDYVPMPIFEYRPMHPRKVVFNRHRLLDVFANVYVEHIVRKGAITYGKLFRLIAEKEDAIPLVFHCTAGKDRTGVASAMLLRMLGVPREMVINDYLLTNYAAQSFIDEVDYQLGARGLRGVAVEQLYPLLAASPRLITDALDAIEAEYGGVIPYLKGPAGLTDEHITTLRDKLLHPA